MADLLLHVGHHKTGSTFIQNTLRANREALAREHGIHYPARGESAARHPVTGVATGNAKELFATATALREAHRHLRPAAPMHLLLSSEALLRELVEHRTLDFLAGTARDLGYARVRMLLFIRDPVSYAASLWQQEVKVGRTETLEEHFAAFAEPEKVARLLDLVEAEPGVALTVRNYTRHKDRLLAVVAGWLGIPDQALAPLPVARVNRSLSKSEVALLLALNRVAGPHTNFLPRTINDRLPEMRVEVARPERAVQQAMLARLGPAMDRVNARIPPQERYEPDLCDPNPLAGEFTFTARQLEVVAEGLGGEIVRLRERLDALRADATAQLSARQLAAALARRVRSRIAGRRRA